MQTHHSNVKLSGSHFDAFRTLEFKTQCCRIALTDMPGITSAVPLHMQIHSRSLSMMRLKHLASNEAISMQ